MAMNQAEAALELAQANYAQLPYSIRSAQAAVIIIPFPAQTAPSEYSSGKQSPWFSFPEKPRAVQPARNVP